MQQVFLMAPENEQLDARGRGLYVGGSTAMGMSMLLGQLLENYYI